MKKEEDKITDDGNRLVRITQVDGVVGGVDACQVRYDIVYMQ